MICMYDKSTIVGLRIIRGYRDIKNKIYVVCENLHREDHKFSFGVDYDLNTGSWANGHYDYNNMWEAIDALFDCCGNDKLEQGGLIPIEQLIQEPQCVLDYKNNIKMLDYMLQDLYCHIDKDSIDNNYLDTITKCKMHFEEEIAKIIG